MTDVPRKIRPIVAGRNDGEAWAAWSQLSEDFAALGVADFHVTYTGFIQSYAAQSPRQDHWTRFLATVKLVMGVEAYDWTRLENLADARQWAGGPYVIVAEGITNHA